MFDQLLRGRRLSCGTDPHGMPQSANDTFEPRG
jgi:hypothetical protein